MGDYFASGNEQSTGNPHCIPWSYSGNCAANVASATSSQGPNTWDMGDPGDALQLFQSEEDCEALDFALREED